MSSALHPLTVNVVRRRGITAVLAGTGRGMWAPVFVMAIAMAATVAAFGFIAVALVSVVACLVTGRPVRLLPRRVTAPAPVVRAARVNDAAARAHRARLDAIRAGRL